MDVLNSEDTGAKNKEMVATAVKPLREHNSPQRAIEEAIALCRIAKTADKDKVKILIAMRALGEAGRKGVIDSMEQLGFKWMRGQAPPGYMELELQDWVAAITGEV